MSPTHSKDRQAVRLLWREAPRQGSLAIVNGKLESLAALAGAGSVRGPAFGFTGGPGGLRLDISGAQCGHEPDLTVVQVRGCPQPVTFYLRDALSAADPVFVPEFGFAAVPGDDPRTWAEVAEQTAARRLRSDPDRFTLEPEESFAAALARHRRRFCPLFLGLGRDMRTFRVHWTQRNQWMEIRPTFAGHETRRRDPEKADDFVSILFTLGHGGTARSDWTRGLDSGGLPILRLTEKDGPMVYALTGLMTLENGPLAAGRVAGTERRHFYPCVSCAMVTAEERDRGRCYANRELYADAEQVLLWCRIRVMNTSATPNYAALSVPHLAPWAPYNRNQWPAGELKFDGERGFSMDRDRVYGLSLIDGVPVPLAEYPFLVYPGKAVTVDIIVPHAPLPAERADKLKRLDFDAHLQGAREYWCSKLEEGGAAIAVPDETVTEALRAGMLQCDMLSFGTEPDGPVGVNVGVFGPIGSESAPIIEFYDFMGRHRLAERALEYFFDEQRADGFIQGFARYESETGPVLALVGNHLRASGNKDWVRRMAPQIKQACRYLLAWREKNRTEECRQRGGYGLIHGKVADADIYLHDFCLNAWSYLGLKRCAEALADIDSEFAAKLKAELAGYRTDILAALRNSLGRSPLVPAGDGSWAPLQVKWDDQDEQGLPLAWPGLGNHNYMHGGTYGPTYLVMAEILDADDPWCGLLMKSNRYPRTVENAARGQPYYSRHDFAHLKRGEVRAFLKTYYNQMASLMDPDTYAFWEHVHDAGSPHKTHEQAWFMMQTRWLLLLEDGPVLRLLPAAPRRWLAHGQAIVLRQVASYYGRLNLRVESHLQEGFISAQGDCERHDPPNRVVLRLPHPEQLTARAVQGGTYDPAAETVTVDNFKGSFEVRLRF